MKLYLFSFLFFLLFLPCSLYSQEYSNKFGKVTDYEMSMTSYDKDTSASVVVIYDIGSTKFSLNDDFEIVTDYSKKMKILKQDGLEEANISFVYDKNEYISRLDACVYNLENGKIQKTKLDKKYVFEKNVTDDLRELKFSLTNVKVGSVIEFKFAKTDKSYIIPSWKIQGDHPVVYSSYSVNIPEYFIYSVETKGYEPIITEKSKGSMSFFISGNNFSCSTEDYVFKAENVPAMKREPYVWSTNDFLSGIQFELSGTKFPGSFYKSYSKTWGDVDNTLYSEDNFTSNFKKSPYQKEIHALVENDTNELIRIQKIYAFIKQKVKWNNEYSFWDNNVRDAVKSGTGNNAQINAILIGALSDEKIHAFPVLLRRRSYGRLPFSRPTVSSFNTYIVGVKTNEGKLYYMDGSATYGGLNMLPEDLLPERARILDKGQKEKWVDLTQIIKSFNTISQFCKLNSDGTLEGTRNLQEGGMFAYSLKERYAKAKDVDDFRKIISETMSLDIDSIRLENLDPLSTTVKYVQYFHTKFPDQGDYIYLNPLIIPHLKENKFIHSERKFPIEFDFPYTITIISNISIPSEFEVEEIPKNEKIIFSDSGIECIYKIVFNNNILNLSYQFKLNRTLFPADDYPFIRELYGKIAVKNTDVVVLKRK